METTQHTWTLATALEIIQPMERLFQHLNAHVALAGSVLYQGWSDNDLDLFFYPHQGYQLDRPGIWGALIACGWGKPEKAGDYPNGREIYVTHCGGRKVNIFMVRLDN